MHIHSVEMCRGWMTFMPQRLRDVQMLTTDRQFWCTKCSAHVGFGLCKLSAICLGDVACCWIDKGWPAINSEWATIDVSCLVALGSLDLRTCCIQTWPESQWHVVASCLRVAEFAEGNLIDNSSNSKDKILSGCALLLWPMPSARRIQLISNVVSLQEANRFHARTCMNMPHFTWAINHWFRSWGCQRCSRHGVQTNLRSR